MSKSQNEGQRALMENVLNAVVAASRATQIRLFHGLVPALATLSDARDQLDSLAQGDWFRRNRRTEGLIRVHAAKAQVSDAVRVIEGLAAELGYPLEASLAAYTASAASLGTLVAMEADLASAKTLDWDAWAATLTDQPGDAAA